MTMISPTARALAALGHDARLSIFRLLVKAGDEGLRVSDLGNHLGLAPSTLAHHLSSLVDAGLVTKGEIDARTNSYQTTARARELVRRAVQSWVDLLDADRQLLADGGPTVRYCADCESVHPVDAACKPWGSTTDDNQR